MFKTINTRRTCDGNIYTFVSQTWKENIIIFSRVRLQLRQTTINSTSIRNLKCLLRGFSGHVATLHGLISLNTEYKHWQSHYSNEAINTRAVTLYYQRQQRRGGVLTVPSHNTAQPLMVGRQLRPTQSCNCCLSTVTCLQWTYQHICMGKLSDLHLGRR